MKRVFKTIEPRSRSHTIVRKAGVTSRYWSSGTRNVEIKFFREIGEPSAALELSFSLPSKGGGDVHVAVRINSGDFPALLEFMSIVDRNASIEAMTIELARQLAGKHALAALGSRAKD